MPHPPLIDHPLYNHAISWAGRILQFLGIPHATHGVRDADARIAAQAFRMDSRKAFELQRQQERELVVPVRQFPYPPHHYDREQHPYYQFQLVAFNEDDDEADAPTASFSARPEGAWQAYRAGERADLRTISFMMGLTLDPDPTAPFGGRDVHGWTDTGVLTGTGKGTSPNAPSTDNGGITGAVAGPAPDTGANAPDANSQAE
jgi:hypothetical protein